ncbi:MAG: SMC-Scp complex subunit ScpB [Candidatus Hodarchaeales archaeon]|jgi:chromosome segregation and condensation protein ScpB
MFRLFRRKKKEDSRESVEEQVPVEKTIKEELVSSSTAESETFDEVVEEKEVFTTKETPFEDKFAHLTHILPESLLEETTISDEQIILPFIKKVIENDSSYSGFISPQILSHISSQESQPREDDYVISRRDIPPATLEERIDGALFSIGRPIHSNELIENFEEDSPTIKRAIRRLSRKRKRTSAIVINEISKDRWVMQLNPIFHEFFQSLEPDLFLLPDERRVVTEIAYRQPISLALVKKMVTGIGPIRVTEICRKLEENGFVASEQRARSLIYTSTPKFAKSFGFDNESRRLKLQMLWRLKRLMGDFEDEEPEELEQEEEKSSVVATSSTTLSEQESIGVPENEDSIDSSSSELLSQGETDAKLIEKISASERDNIENTDLVIKEVSEIKSEKIGEEE